MCIKKIKKFYKKYAERHRSFFSNIIAGLITGVMIGVLFSLITSSKFDRWINIFSYEIFAAIVYFTLTFLFLWILYFFGKLCLYLFISKKKKDLVNFKINYFSGIYSASFATSLILLHSEIRVAIYVSAIFLLLVLPVEYFTIKNKRKR